MPEETWCSAVFLLAGNIPGSLRGWPLNPSNLCGAATPPDHSAGWKPSINCRNPNAAPANIASTVTGAEKLSTENAVMPWPTVQPIAITAPAPIRAAPAIWRRNSRGSSQASHRKWPFNSDPAKAPRITPATDPTANVASRPDPVITNRMDSPSGAEKLWETTGIAVKPCVATQWVPAQPRTMARPTTTAQSIAFGSLTRAREERAASVINAPAITPSGATGRPVVEDRRCTKPGGKPVTSCWKNAQLRR